MLLKSSISLATSWIFIDSLPFLVLEMSCCKVAVEGTQSLPNLEGSGSKRQLCEGGLPIVREAVRGFEGMEWEVHLWVISGLYPAPTSKNLLGRCPSRLLRRDRDWVPYLSTPMFISYQCLFLQLLVLGRKPLLPIRDRWKNATTAWLWPVFYLQCKSVCPQTREKDFSVAWSALPGGTGVSETKTPCFPPKPPARCCTQSSTSLNFHFPIFPSTETAVPPSEAGNEMTRGKALWKQSQYGATPGMSPSDGDYKEQVPPLCPRRAWYPQTRHGCLSSSSAH